MVAGKQAWGRGRGRWARFSRECSNFLAKVRPVNCLICPSLVLIKLPIECHKPTLLGEIRTSTNKLPDAVSVFPGDQSLFSSSSFPLSRDVHIQSHGRRGTKESEIRFPPLDPSISRRTGYPEETQVKLFCTKIFIAVLHVPAKALEKSTMR